MNIHGIRDGRGGVDDCVHKLVVPFPAADPPPVATSGPVTRDALVQTLFASVIDNPPWHAFLQKLETYLACRGATVVLRMPQAGLPGVLISTSGTDWSLNSFHNQSFGPSFLSKLPNDKVQILRERFSSAELAQEEYYSRYLHVFGIHDILSLNLLDAETGAVFRLRCARRSTDPRFGEVERRLVEGLVPHLRTALAVYARLTVQELGLSIHDEVEEQLEIGSFMLDETASVIHANREAGRLLETHDGLCIRAGRLCDSAEGARRPLAQALARLGQARRTGEPADDIEFDVFDEETEMTSLRVLCRPLIGRAALDGRAIPSVLVLARRAKQPARRISAEKLMPIFGLTKAEANLAEKLASGCSLYESAVTLGISRATARCHLSAIFSKTNCHRQAELVSLILTTVHGLWPEKQEPVAAA